MKCVYCSFSETKVVDKRDSNNLNVIKRRRECLQCAKRFTTYEQVEEVQLIVEKKDGHTEPFEREKLKSGILIACEKRISEEKIEIVVSKIESKLRKLKSTTISSDGIGQEVLRRLKVVDPVAYLRFASVHKDFHDIKSFKDELYVFTKKSR